MIAQLLKNVDGFERLRAGSSKQLLNLGRGDEESVERELYGAKSAEHDVFVFDGH